MRRVLFSLLCLLATEHSAFAVDLNFSANLSGLCSLGLSTPGTLGLSVDGAKMSSEHGLPAVLTVVSVGTNTVTIATPTWNPVPAGYDTSGQSMEVSYSGAGGLAAVNQAFTSNSSNFSVSTLPLTLVQVHARANNTHGFPAGSYQMKVVATCS